MKYPGDAALGKRDEIRGVPVLWKPSPGPQTAFLASTAREVLYGGAVGGGKTDALLMGALRFVGHPDFQGVMLRREKEDLRENIDRAREFWPRVCLGAKWVEERKRFEFPSGASVLFGAAQHEEDIEAYKSYEFSYVAFDELTTFTHRQYVYMLSRNRAPMSAGLPLMVRSGTNPDGPGHEWVFKRFVRDREPYRTYRHGYEVEQPDGSLREVSLTRQFIPSTIYDNPHIGSVDEYIAGLMSMGPDLADALLMGSWDYFRGQMFPYDLQEVEPGLKQPGHYVVRAMDYGWSNPSVVLWLVVYPSEDADTLPLVEVADELVVTETDTDSIAHLVKHREDALRKDFGVGKPRLSVIDPSAARSEGTSKGQNIVDMLLARGVWFEKANNDRQSGWAQLRRFLGAKNSEGEPSPRLRLWRNRAPYLRESLPTLVRDPKKADDLRRAQDDHGADTLRYGLHAVVDTGGTLPARQEAYEGQSSLRDTGFERYLQSVLNGERSGLVTEGF